MARLFRCATAVIAGAVAVGCDGRNVTIPIDAPPGDAAPIIADAAPLGDGATAWVDLVVSGCELVVDPPADGGVSTRRCRGPAPLTVHFATLTPGSVDTWAWHLAQGTTSNQATPVHTYALPGRYDVTVSVGGPGGTATAARPGFVEVVGAPLASACALDAQCTSGACLCNAASECPPGLSLGMCTATCGASCAGGVCGVLGAGGDEPWHGELCLEPCDRGDVCPGGRSCEVVASAGGGWVRACLPAGGLASLGDSCAGIAGVDDARCTTGSCLAIGARGACSVSCGPTAPCPDGARCATFGNGVRACLRACDEDCGDDPWLACEAPGGPGAWGFTLDESGTVCAPRRCSDSSACPDGACVDGHCAATP